MIPNCRIGSVSPWMTSTNFASVMSKRTSGAVFSKYGPAGSRPALNKNDKQMTSYVELHITINLVSHKRYFVPV